MVKQQRTEFDKIKKTAVTLSESLGTDTTFKERRASRKKKCFEHSDEKYEDDRLVDAELHFKTAFFMQT